MSFRAIAEVFLHCESFSNVDLFEQGAYFARFLLYYEKDGKRFLANPYNASAIVKKDKNKKQYLNHNANKGYHNVISSQIEDDSSAFCTRAFMIRYADEEVSAITLG
jgi:hypothetical protein